MQILHCLALLFVLIVPSGIETLKVHADVPAGGVLIVPSGIETS